MEKYFKDEPFKLTPELIKELMEEHNKNTNLLNIDNDEEDNYACEAYTPEGAPPMGMLMGWICPKCGAVMSPYQSFCVKCTGNWEITYGTGTPYSIPTSSEVMSNGIA